MKKLVPIVIAVVAVAGVTGFFLTKDSSDSTSGTKKSTSSSAFDAVATAGQSFRLTISNEGTDGKKTRAVMEADAKTGAVRYKATGTDEAMSFVYTKDAYYMCLAEDNCYKYALGQGSGAAFDPSSYQYDESKLSSFKTSSTALGEEDCPAGRCDVWKITTNGTDAKVYIDTKTKRVSQVVSTVNGNISTAAYEYTDVTVAIPANAKEIPATTLPTN